MRIRGRRDEEGKKKRMKEGVEKYKVKREERERNRKRRR
jgi:hypothetical protein